MQVRKKNYNRNIKIYKDLNDFYHLKKVCDKANLTSSQVKGFYAVRIKKAFTLEDEILNAGLTFEKLEKKVC